MALLPFGAVPTPFIQWEAGSDVTYVLGHNLCFIVEACGGKSFPVCLSSDPDVFLLISRSHLLISGSHLLISRSLVCLDSNADPTEQLSVNRPAAEAQIESSRIAKEGNRSCRRSLEARGVCRVRIRWK
ncbi:hypothetical protein CDAR_294801 [Caerostris darwini]|uniref:Uncharacterized protein n=1 Tax=Caerostris darwini TaxID=1538125 RepID=A0AAV4UKS8_9ARAC|nr:hypothetical protein CDAR_294801 [Caerostris darwini]